MMTSSTLSSNVALVQPHIQTRTRTTSVCVYASLPSSIESSSTRDVPTLPAATITAPRRTLLAVIGAAAVGVLSQRDAAEAFGSGFPGYDMNVEGRKRAMERNKKEMAADLARAAKYREELAKKKAAAAAASK